MDDDRHLLRTLGEVALNLAISESLANHGHHALANAHEAAANSHKHLAEAGLGDVERHLDLVEWHSWCAVVEHQLAGESDEKTPTRRD